MSFKGKKYRNSGENGGQKIFSWSKIRAIGQQIAKSKTAAALHLLPIKNWLQRKAKRKVKNVKMLLLLLLKVVKVKVKLMFVQ